MTLCPTNSLEALALDAARNLEEAKVDWEDVDPTTIPVDEIARVEDVFRSERGQWGQLVVKQAPSLPTAPASTKPAPGAPDGPSTGG